MGQGSTFTLHLPVDPHGAGAAQPLVSEAAGVHPPWSFSPLYAPSIVATEKPPAEQAIVTRAADDRYNIQPNDRVLLIAEDDLDFGTFVCEVALGHGFKCLLAPDGHSALALIGEFQPDAVILDIGLPHLDGWRLLDRLKSDLGTRHIPVTDYLGQRRVTTRLKDGLSPLLHEAGLA